MVGIYYIYFKGEILTKKEAKRIAEILEDIDKCTNDLTGWPIYDIVKYTSRIRAILLGA